MFSALIDITARDLMIGW